MAPEIENGKRAAILFALEDLGGTANTSQIREESGIDTHQLNYHLQVLRGESGERFRGDPLVETDGQEQLDDVPIPANIYRLTDAGRDAIEDLDESAAIDPSAELEEVRSELQALREDHEQLRDNFNQLLDRLERGEI